MELLRVEMKPAEENEAYTDSGFPGHSHRLDIAIPLTLRHGIVSTGVIFNGSTSY